MTDLELMKWALYALEGSNAYDWPVVEELKQRLAQPVQEPVAWMYVNTDGECEQIEYSKHCPIPDDPSVTPLYTTPRQWQELTEDDSHKTL